MAAPGKQTRLICFLETNIPKTESFFKMFFEKKSASEIFFIPKPKIWSKRMLFTFFKVEGFFRRKKFLTHLTFFCFKVDFDEFLFLRGRYE